MEWRGGLNFKGDNDDGEFEVMNSERFFMLEMVVFVIWKTGVGDEMVFMFFFISRYFWEDVSRIRHQAFGHGNKVAPNVDTWQLIGPGNPQDEIGFVKLML